MSANVTVGAEKANTGLTAVPNNPHQVRANTIQPFLRKAMESPINIGEIPASLFSGKLDSNHNLSLQNSHTSRPILKSNSRNNILIYPGSFNPPHLGHLATIRYFSERRDKLDITAMFIFVDPGSIVQGKKKKWGDIILPQELRYELFYRVPEIFQLVESGWLQLLVGDMDTHIKVLRMTTDLISEAGFDVKLVGLLGGDKLTVESAPHLHPGSLQEWGSVDEFLIINARRPVDFFDSKKEEIPRNLPGCTAWEKDLEAEEEKTEHLNESAGVLWICRALTVAGNPIIRFRASQSSASNGVSSTKIRQIMAEAHNEELMEELNDKVISADFLVEWLLIQRKAKRESIDEKAFL
ncbi:85805aa7-8619-4687-891d-16c7619b6a68 [Sclerotinia trifoliorum]|uniref:85805aa7-8619-4687-891d-16c7619b6a68 n=1 Tax=Sclerotinia trifoliorum TaxID=28548 RepID=A0A8H2ZNQ1_9HELO|nr:85805aa7-8619-4687-891d-16c7619b6a68 [Sclerotinia trifoliorum]